MTAVSPLWRRRRESPVAASDGPPAPVTTPEPSGRSIRLVVLAAVLLGLVLRLWIVFSPLGPFDSDEAVAGLTGRHLLDGELRVFYWGQAYGGTHEAALLAVLFALGVSASLAMELVPIGLSAAAAVLVWRIGLRTIGRRGALFAGALFWTTSAAFIWQSTKERSFYATTVVAGLGVTLLTLRLLDRPSRRDALLLGLVGGVGWHSSPNIVYFAVPALAWLVAESVRAGKVEVLRLWWVAALGGVAGALPWIVSNIATGGASFDLSKQAIKTTYLDRLGLFFRKALPYALGTQTPYEPIRWPSVLLYLAIAAGLVVALLRLPRTAWGIGAGMLAFPIIFAAFPTSWYVSEPRYLVFLWPFVVLVVAAALAQIRRRRLTLVVLAAIAVYTIGGTALMVERSRSSVIPDFSPGDLKPLIAQLRTLGIDRAFADYWIAYRLDLASDESILAAPLESARYEPYEVKVRAAVRPAYVFFRQSCLEGEFQGYLDDRDVAYTRNVAGRFSVVQPGQKVLPEEGFMARASAKGIYQSQICPPGTMRLP